MEEYKTLDNILLFIKEHSVIDYRTMLMMITDLNSPLKHVSNQEMLSGVKKLVKDGYVEEKNFKNNTGLDIATHRNETLYSISYDGIIFLKNGGYLERETQKTTIAEKETPVKNPNIQDWTKSIKWNIAIGLFVTIFGALVVYAIIEIIKTFSKT